MNHLLLKPDVSVSPLYVDHEHYHDGDSGIDLYCPETVTILPKTLHKIDMKIQCEMKCRWIREYRNVTTLKYVGDKPGPNGNEHINIDDDGI